MNKPTQQQEHLEDAANGQSQRVPLLARTRTIKLLMAALLLWPCVLWTFAYISSSALSLAIIVWSLAAFTLLLRSFMLSAKRSRRILAKSILATVLWAAIASVPLYFFLVPFAVYTRLNFEMWNSGSSMLALAEATLAYQADHPKLDSFPQDRDELLTTLIDQGYLSADYMRTWPKHKLPDPAFYYVPSNIGSQDEEAIIFFQNPDVRFFENGGWLVFADGTTDYRYRSGFTSPAYQLLEGQTISPAH